MMETTVAHDIDVESKTAPMKNEHDLLGDFGSVSVPEKIEPFNKSVTPEPNLLESVDEGPLTLAKEPEPLLNINDNFPSEPKQATNFISGTQDFLNDLKSERKPSPEPAASEVLAAPPKEAEPFGFNKPLPPEPVDIVNDFLKAEANGSSKISDDKDDDANEFLGAAGDASPAPLSREESPIPPPVPKHQSLRDESPDRFESSPEPDFKPMESGRDIDDVEPPRPITPPPKHEEPKKNTEKEQKKSLAGDIGAKDIIVEIVEVTSRHRHRTRFWPWLFMATTSFIDAWFNPARLHPLVESLVYWRDPKKSGIVFGVLMVTLLSLTTFSLISVVAYLGLLTLAGTISFRIYKNIMQAVQKTSDGHPFKDLLDMEISLPEDKVAETSRMVTQHVNAAISALRSLFLVEDLVDSIKGLVLFWALTYIGAVFNGLTLLILGVLLVFSLPRLYEKNKAQVDAYIQIAMDKLSIITNRMRAAIPSGKKEEKPKDQ